MWERARSFFPSLADAKTVPWYPLAQGLRPITRKNVKVRADITNHDKVIHNYGHSGSGWTLAIGASRSAIHLVDMMVKGKMTAEEANGVLYPK
jgi:D-amino-acid oxidase